MTNGDVFLVIPLGRARIQLTDAPRVLQTTTDAGRVELVVTDQKV